MESDTKAGAEGTIASRSPNPLTGAAKEKWLEIRQKAADTMVPSVAEIKKIDPEAIVGIRGSLARGSKGKNKGYTAFDTSEFDVDAFIVSDAMAMKAPYKQGEARWGDRRPDVRRISRIMDGKLRKELPNMKSEPFGFRIFTTAEFNSFVRKNDNVIVFE